MPITTTDRTYRTITLTGRPPVRIVDADWPLLAEASYHDWNGQYDFQSPRHWRGWIMVRQHADGRALVYAACTYQTQYQGENGYAQRGGELLPTGATQEAIIAAIYRVHVGITIADATAHGTHWQRLADECIADLPAEDI
jgi:hypothetical protein